MDEKGTFSYKIEPRRLILKLVGFNCQKIGFKRSTGQHCHDVWSMEFCISGTTGLEIDNRHYTCKRGDIILIPPGVKHHFIYAHDAFSCYSFKMTLPELELPENISIYAGDPQGLKQRLGMIGAVGSCLTGFCPEETLNSHLAFPVSSNLSEIRILEELLYGITCHYIYGEARTDSDFQEELLLKRISEFVYQHGGKPVTVEDAAAYLNYSSGYLRALVKKLTGFSTKKFIDLERIKIMKDHLLYSDVYIGELSHLMGFQDPKYFTRFFRKYTGKNPRDWQKKTK